MLDALEDKDIIERKPHPTSRRAHLVYLTDSGKSLKTEGISLVMKTNKRIYVSAIENASKIYC